MSCSPTSRFVRKFGGGFTMVEMMVSVAILVLIMAMFSQILVLVSRAWTDGQKKVNNFSKARAMLDMFSRDVQAGVFRSDLAAFPGGAISFYTKVPGIPSNGGAVRRVSLVQYGYNIDQSSSASMSTLQRGDMAISWNAPAGAIPFGNTADFGGNVPSPRDTAFGVLAYKVTFVYADGTASSNYTEPDPGKPLRALALTLAVVDDQTLHQLSKDQIQTLRDGLDLHAGGAGSVKAAWEKYLGDGSGPGWSSYPKSLGNNLKIFERYVLLPN